MVRGLAFVLLAGIVYGITFGSAHSHGNPSKPQVNIVAGHEISTSTVSTLRSQPGFECLVCLFHQNLFNSTIPGAIFSATSSQPEVRPTAAPLTSYSSPFTSTPVARLSGRAPPLV
ncbi:MAG: hypothetical protein ABI999_13095 [Acidobacteriota bacterium]